MNKKDTLTTKANQEKSAPVPGEFSAGFPALTATVHHALAGLNPGVSPQAPVHPEGCVPRGPRPR